MARMWNLDELFYSFLAKDAAQDLSQLPFEEVLGDSRYCCQVVMACGKLKRGLQALIFSDAEKGRTHDQQVG